MIIGSNSPSSSLTRKVGIGSREHDFPGDDRIRLLTNSSEHGENSRNEETVEIRGAGKGFPWVSALTEFTFFSKKSANSSAEKYEAEAESGGRLTPKTPDSERHNCLEPLEFCIRPIQ